MRKGYTLIEVILLLVIVGLLALVPLSMIGSVREVRAKNACIAKGYPTMTRSWLFGKQYCARVENGTTVMVPLAEVK